MIRFRNTYKEKWLTEWNTFHAGYGKNSDRKKTPMVYILADDLDGTTKGVKTVQFSLDGVEYEIDLSPEHASALRKSLKRYAKHGREVGKEAPVTSGAKYIRQWANSHGHDVSERGKIPAFIIDAFQVAHPNPA